MDENTVETVDLPESLVSAIRMLKQEADRSVRLYQEETTKEVNRRLNDMVLGFAATIDAPAGAYMKLSEDHTQILISYATYNE